MTSNWNLGRKRLLWDNTKTLLLLLLLAILTAAVGWVLGGVIGLVIGVGFLALMMSVGFKIPAWLVMRLYGATPLELHQAPDLFAMVRRISVSAGVTPPKLYYIPAAAPNALAISTGPNAGALAVTQGAINAFTAEELQGVLAHEVAHLKHGDTGLLQAIGLVAGAMSLALRLSLWIGLFVFILSGAGIAHLATLAIMALVAPVIVVMIHATIARTREFAADARAAQITGAPLALAAALEKLEAQTRPRRVTQLGGRRGSLFRSHPSTAARVTRLREMARDDGSSSAEVPGANRRHARRVSPPRASAKPSAAPDDRLSIA